MYSKICLQNFQRIQRNRQSRIRVKLCRRAGKRQDEILVEEDDASSPSPAVISPPAAAVTSRKDDDADHATRLSDDIDIVGAEATVASTAIVAAAPEKSSGQLYNIVIFLF
jgi:hypothetical protein